MMHPCSQRLQVSDAYIKNMASIPGYTIELNRLRGKSTITA